MPLIKKIDERVTLIGVAHIVSEQNRGIYHYIKTSDIIAIEGYSNRESINVHLLQAFFGKDEISLLKKLHIPLTTLDPIVNKCVKIPLKFSLLIGITSSLLTEAFYYTSVCLNQHWLYFVPYLYTSLFGPAIYGYFSKTPNKVLNNKYYLKFLDSNLKVLSQLGRYLVSNRDTGMAYGIKKLIKAGYKKITALTGMYHVYPIPEEGYRHDRQDGRPHGV